jgi:hypothetical protein
MVGEIGLRPQRCSSSGIGRLRKSPEKVLAVVKGDVPMALMGSRVGRPFGRGGFTLVDMVDKVLLFFFKRAVAGGELK